MSNSILLSINLLFSILIAALVWGAGISYTPFLMRIGDNSKNLAKKYFENGMNAQKNNDYQTAQNNFEQAWLRDKQNPEILNMLAYTNLKLGDIDNSLKIYKMALKERPQFPATHKYLGEAYIQAALNEIETLESYGSSAREDLENLKKELKKAAGKI